MLNSLKRWSLAVVLMIYLVIVVGAYTRLSDSGLGCPDWPGCYGKLVAPASKYAWTEMIHRYIAGTLGIIILVLWFKSVLLYKSIPKLWLITTALLGLVIFQALLGMWTVTLRLYPIVVMGHLLGGFAILGLSCLLYLKLTNEPASYFADNQMLKLAYWCLAALIIQIALGGWTSANYAALVCADFPSCQGHWWPPMDWLSAFNLTRAGIFDSPGVPLENTARVTIQMAHRLGAAITSILLATLSYNLIKQHEIKLRNMGILLVILLITQVALGISNVLAGLPLAIALMHNAVAALLLILMVGILYKLHGKSSNST